MSNDIERVLISEEEIAAVVADMGAKISADYSGKNLLLLCVLKGSAIFMADLMRAITLPVTIDFMAVSSYGNGAVSTGQVNIIKDVNIPPDVHVLIVEDILDTGRTLHHLTEYLELKGALSVEIATLLDKPDRRVADVTPRYTGFAIPDEFVVGYGLDYAEKYRNLPFVGVLNPTAILV